MTPAGAQEIGLRWQNLSATIPTHPDILQAAIHLAADHQRPIGDAVILPAASCAGCRLLLSEDLQRGFTWGGVTVVRPLAERRHWLHTNLLARGDR